MKLQHNAPLAGYTSLHAGGKAHTLLELEPGDDLNEVIAKAGGPVWVLGFGTNVLVSDKGLPGTVILNQSGKIEVLDNGQVRADSGANWDELVQKAILNNLWGLEFTSGIPGGVGAAIAGNIAAYGHKVANSFVKATILDTKDGSVHIWEKPQFGFDYRSSNLQLPENNSLVILDATFQLSLNSIGELEYESALKTAAELGIKPDNLENRRKIILETRRKAGSLLNDSRDGPWTAGSFFKNPLVDEAQIQTIIDHEESSISREQLLRQNVIHGGNKARVSAAHVLLAAGFSRGQSWGNIRLHPDHILKIENIGNASSQEIYDVVQNIITSVQQKLNITLEPEVRFIGDFS
jgi:UDP-N-acetylmuramate dehydrogenase